MSQEKLVGELGHTLILHDLNGQELKRIAPLFETREYEIGERILEQDSIGSELHLLLDGMVEVRVRGSEKAEMRIGTVGKGEMLGEASIFMDFPRTASVVAMQNCVVAAITRDKLFAFCDANSRAGLRIFAFVIYSLLKRLGATSRNLALEREAVVTPEDIERLRTFFPKSIDEMLEEK